MGCRIHPPMLGRTRLPWSALLVSSALGQQLGLQDVLLQVEIARQPGRAVFAAPHTEQATLPHE